MKVEIIPYYEPHEEHIKNVESAVRMFREEKEDGKKNRDTKLGNRTGDGVSGNFNGRKVPDRKVQRA